MLSKGHDVVTQYACLNEIGWLLDDEILRYFANDTRLKSLANAHIPGIEVTTGLLGVGLALGAKTKNRPHLLHACWDNKRATWEAALFAAQFQLDNLLVIIDVDKQWEQPMES